MSHPASPNARILLLSLALFILLTAAACSSFSSSQPKRLDPGSVPIHKVALAFPRTELSVHRGGKLERSPGERQVRAAVDLIQTLVRKMPNGARLMAPLPHELGEHAEQSICHRDSFLSLARLIDESSENRKMLKDIDPLQHVLKNDEPVCELEQYHDADALLITYLHGTEGEWMGNTANIVAAVALTAATMGRVVVIPGSMQQGLTLRAVLADPKSHKLLATAEAVSSLSASQENLEDMMGEIFECFERFDRMDPKKIPRYSGRGCRSMRPYHFVYEG